MRFTSSTDLAAANAWRAASYFTSTVSEDSAEQRRKPHAAQCRVPFECLCDVMHHIGIALQNVGGRGNDLLLDISPISPVSPGLNRDIDRQDIGTYDLVE